MTMGSIAFGLFRMGNYNKIREMKTYLVFIENVVKFALSNKLNFPLLEVLKSLMHKSLIDDQSQKKVVAVISEFLE